MSFVAELMDTAVADIDVLRSLDSNGDHFDRFREVDFLILAASRENAEIVAGFVNDHCLGEASVSESEDTFRVTVVIKMPVTQSVILCVSGYMACIAHLFGASYDGWGCVAQS